jgi:hypothetical protein
MSLQFNDTTTRKGLVQFYEKETGREYGVVSGSATRRLDFAADVNVAHDELMHIASEASGTWRADDSNHTELPIIRFDITSSQRTYILLNDEQGNLILSYDKVLVAGPDGIYRPITPRDPISEMNVSRFVDGQNTQGVPTSYDKLANGIRFDLEPNYSLAGGIEMYITREGYYVTADNATWKPGVPGNLHAWYYIHPAEAYARQTKRKNLGALQMEKARLEQMIKDTFSRRTRDERPRMRPFIQNNR